MEHKTTSGARAVRTGPSVRESKSSISGTRAVLPVMTRCLLPGVLGTFVLLLGATAYAQTPTGLAVPPDSPRWDLEGRAKVAEMLGRKCLLLDGGAATVKDFEMRDGVVDVDVAVSAGRGFSGFQFRIAADGANAEEIYLRHAQVRATRRASSTRRFSPPGATGRSTTVRASPAASTSRRTPGSTCASRSRARRRSSSSGTWRGPRS